MPKKRYPHLRHEMSRHGKFVWYFRRERNGPRIRIRAEYGTPEFEQEYLDALRGMPPDKTRRNAKTGSLKWLCERYKESMPWRQLSPSTRKVRDNIYLRVIKFSGDVPFREITRRDIEAGRDARADHPAAALHFLNSMRALYRFAYEAGYVQADPTTGILNPKKKPTQGFPVWTEEDIERYHAHWPRGTRERVWMDVLLYTGLRRGDAVRLGRQHVSDGVASIRTEKSQGKVLVTIPILPELEKTLEAGPTGDLAFICTARGTPFTKESFGNEFREACRAAGVEKSAHGLRKAGATRAAENGATVAELEAIFGWSGGKMATYYTRSANRQKLAMQAMEKMRDPEKKERSKNKNAPHLMPRCGAKTKTLFKNKEL